MSLHRHEPAAWSLAVVLAGLLVYLFVSFSDLTVYPPVGEDEPWIAAAPYKLASEGVYGSDLFAGYYGVERHNYQHMPLYPLVQASIFRLFGVGVLQMRILPVACGFLLLLVTFLVGRQVGGGRLGALAVVLLVALRVMDGSDGTGILLLDRARVNRYDIAVPVFGLLALAALNRAESARGTMWAATAGALVGLSSLTHLFGAFWLPVLLSTLAIRRGPRGVLTRAPWALLAGFAVPWLPWAAYVATGWSDFIGQMRFVGERLDVLNPSFYLSNAMDGEGPIAIRWGLRTIRQLPLARPGTWVMLVGTPAAVGIMLWRTRRHPSDAVFGLAAAALAQTLMFLFLLKVKTVNYMIGLWPLVVLCLAWLGIWLWDRATLARARVALMTIVALVVIEGGARVAHARSVARRTTPYDWYASQVAGCIPDGSLVLGLQHYWLGLRQYRYRTWLMPLNFAHPRYYHAPLTLDEALERVDPDVILVDRYVQLMLDNARPPDHPNHRYYVGFEAFVARRGVEPACVIRDRTYGTMLVYRVPGRRIFAEPVR